MEQIIADAFGPYGLTNREIEVVTLIIVQGYSNKALAEVLHISEKTVKNHVANVFAKLNIGNVRQLMPICLRGFAKGLSA
ncbi:response regulator transcription factor [Cohnella suwonensis]|uniref:Response regulator transcription factor n=1 Tax=Cohnella suwonensis TaxID=696072 RepID=A0ABW0LNI0_9BACL